jgi:hypothetical protein
VSEQQVEGVKLPDGRVVHDSGGGGVRYVDAFPATPEAHAANEGEFRQGYAAGIGGLPEASNPHFPVLTPHRSAQAAKARREAWKEGWRTGDGDRRYYAEERQLVDARGGSIFVRPGEGDRA